MPCACAGRQKTLAAKYVLSSSKKHKKEKQEKK